MTRPPTSPTVAAGEADERERQARGGAGHPDDAVADPEDGGLRRAEQRHRDDEAEAVAGDRVAAQLDLHQAGTDRQDEQDRDQAGVPVALVGQRDARRGSSNEQEAREHAHESAAGQHPPSIGGVSSPLNSGAPLLKRQRGAEAPRRKVCVGQRHPR